MVVGADRYLDITYPDTSTAVVRSKVQDHSFELKMRKEAGAWRVVGVRDDQAATQIARAIGQEILEIAKSGKNASDPNLDAKQLIDTLKRAEDILK